MTFSKTIYEIFAEYAADLGVNFDFGSFKEIQKRLVEKSAGGVSRYPLICLVTPVPETKNPSPKYISEVTVHLVIFAETRKEYTTAQRLENVFKPVLYPIVDALEAKITGMDYFDTDETGRLVYDYVDVFHYSATDAKEQNKLAAVLDAVEITNFKLNVLPQNCI